MKIELPEKVKTVIDELKAHGYDAYAVGGCIRDSILGRTPGDWDITTSAKPHQVKARKDLRSLLTVLTANMRMHAIRKT